MWRPIRKHAWSLLGLAAASGLLAALVAYSLEPLYQAETTLLLESRRQDFSPLQAPGDSGRCGPLDSRTLMQTQAILMESRVMAEAVVDRLRLWEDPEFDPRQIRPRRARIAFDWIGWFGAALSASGPVPVPTEAEARARTIDAVAGQVQADPLPDALVIRLGARAHDPNLAARIANAYADLAVEMGLEMRLRAVGKTAAWVTERLDGLREKLAAAELKLQVFREAEGLVELPGSSDLVGKQLSSLAGRVIEARAKRDDVQVLYDQIQQVEPWSGVELAAYPMLARNATLQALKASESKAEGDVSELAKRYGPQHPKMVAALADLEAIRGRRTTEVDRAVSGVRKELDLARVQADKLEAELAAADAKAQDAARKDLTLRDLKRAVESDRQLYEFFLTRLKETDLGTEGSSTQVRVIDPARVPPAPVAPKVRRILVVTTLLALMVGGIAAFLMESPEATRKTDSASGRRWRRFHPRRDRWPSNGS